jgi:hypothetical protein
MIEKMKKNFRQIKYHQKFSFKQYLQKKKPFNVIGRNEKHLEKKSNFNNQKEKQLYQNNDEKKKLNV